MHNFDYFYTNHSNMLNSETFVFFSNCHTVNIVGRKLNALREREIILEVNNWCDNSCLHHTLKFEPAYLMYGSTDSQTASQRNSVEIIQIPNKEFSFVLTHSQNKPMCCVTRYYNTCICMYKSTNLRPGISYLTSHCACNTSTVRKKPHLH